MNTPTAAVALHDAAAFCASAVDKLASTRPGQGCVVFDLDNTLVDTRYRTLRAAHAFAAQRLGDQHPLARIGLADVAYDGLATGARAGLRGGLLAELGDFWLRFFWHPESFALDVPIEATTRWAHAAAAAGARVVYLTGRVCALHGETLAQLRRLALPVADASALVCKPIEGLRTATYKAAVLADLLRQRAALGWFMTESRRDVATVQQRLGPRAGCVLVDFPVQHAEPPAVAPGTPVLSIRGGSQTGATEGASIHAGMRPLEGPNR